jgi:hypothetical protein
MFNGCRTDHEVPDTFRRSELPTRNIFVLPDEAYARMAKDPCNLLNAAS